MGQDDGDLAEEGGQVVRTYLMDGPALTDLVGRAREPRIAAGTLTGTAAGEEVITERPVTYLLDDVLGVFASGESRLWSETICTRLAEVNPDVYDGYDANLLGKAFRAHGVETEQMEYVDPDDPDGKRKNRKGITREALLQALADR
jgi:DNA segregation ATPase FtsK/SpoIIIE, S-DNA-T family